MKIIPRAEAKALGLKRYFSGSPCKHGHITERLTINGSCCECSRLKQLASYVADREGNLRKQKERRDSNPNLAAQKLARRHRGDPELAARYATRKLEREARTLAAALGHSKYESTKLCAQGHRGQRFVVDGKCVECNRLACLKRYGLSIESDPIKVFARRVRIERKKIAAQARAERVETSKAWHAARVARQAAIKAGDKSYSGKPCQNGHSGLRYTADGSCIECAAIEAASEEKKQYDFAYYRNNMERIRERTRRYLQGVAPLIVKERARRWAKANPEKRRAISKAYSARRRAIEKGGDSTAAIYKWEQAAKKVCYWCGINCKKKYHVDHYVALARGGKHEVKNLVIACAPCNLKKNAKDPYDFAATMGRLF